jgi:pimeloyl-ACP methyl ester carboxylesterase
MSLLGKIPFIEPVSGIIAGCLFPEAVRPGQFERGCVVMLPGIECSSWQFAGTVLGLRDAGLDRAVKIVQWGHSPFGYFNNLMNLRFNRVRAKRVAGRIGEYQADFPERPITLIGYSGGGGMAALVAGMLEERVMLDRVILIAAAISPNYDFSKALARSRSGMVNFYSPGDGFILGWGTRAFGTIDRQKTVAAGRVGFLDEQGVMIENDRLVQIGWEPAWRDLGHDGGHVGWLSRAWAKQVLAPQIDPSLRHRVAAS